MNPQAQVCFFALLTAPYVCKCWGGQRGGGKKKKRAHFFLKRHII